MADDGAADPFCSVIIPTIGRNKLARAAHSVLSQAGDGLEFELIVVNDSGRPLPSEPWMTDPRCLLLTTDRVERCLARNSGAQAARGRYLLFLDDDDWLLPGALAHLQRFVAENPDAAWVYGRTQIVDREGAPQVVLQHRLEAQPALQLMAGEWIPIQASLIRRELFLAVEGFVPWMHAGQDTDLGRRLALHGAQPQEVVHTVCCLEMGEEGSSTAADRRAEFTRRGRELLLDRPGTFAALAAGAGSASWNGRLARIYLGSWAWNLRRGRMGSALQRLGLTLRAVGRRPFDLLRADFWRSLLSAYHSAAFAPSPGFSAADPAFLAWQSQRDERTVA